jgi:hypothetical protein
MSISQKLLIALTLAVLAYLPFSLPLAIKEILLIVPTLFLLTAACAIYFDQRLIAWRKQLIKHKKMNSKACKIKFCLLHNV